MRLDEHIRALAYKAEETAVCGRSVHLQAADLLVRYRLSAGPAAPTKVQASTIARVIAAMAPGIDPRTMLRAFLFACAAAARPMRMVEKEGIRSEIEAAKRLRLFVRIPDDSA